MDAAARIREYGTLYDDGSTWRNTIMRLASLVRPMREDVGRPLVDGARRARNLYDATGIVANNNLGSAVYGSASNPADKWFQIGTDDPDFDKWPKAKSALVEFSRRTLSSYGPSWSTFYAQSFPLYLDVTGLGMGYFYQALRYGRDGAVDGFTDKCIPLSEAEFRIDDEGRVTHFYRRFTTSLENAATLAKQRGGTLSEKALKLLGEKPHADIELQHSVYPNDAYVSDRLGPEGKPFASCCDQVQEKFQISRQGYDDMPYTVPAWERAAGERHGRGAGEMAYSDLMSLQVMQRANLMGGEWAANPAWGYPHDANLSLTRLRPGALVAGAVDMRNNQLLRRLQENGGTPFSLEMANQLRQAIKDAFEGAIINIIAPNRTGMTPTEVLDVREEKFRRMAPYQGNITAGHLDLHVRRRFALLMRQGVFKDVMPPKELADKVLHPKFTSPMALAQAAARASNAVRAAGAVLEVAKVDASILDRFDADNYAQTVFAGYGVPELMHDDDATEQRRRGREKQQKAMALAEIADKAAGAAQKGAAATADLRAPRPGA